MPQDVKAADRDFGRLAVLQKRSAESARANPAPELELVDIHPSPASTS